MGQRECGKYGPQGKNLKYYNKLQNDPFKLRVKTWSTKEQVEQKRQSLQRHTCICSGAVWFALGEWVHPLSWQTQWEFEELDLHWQTRPATHTLQGQEHDHAAEQSSEHTDGIFLCLCFNGNSNFAHKFHNFQCFLTYVLTSLPLQMAMLGWRGVIFSVWQGLGRWLSNLQLASLLEMDGNSSRDRYMYCRQLNTQKRQITH